MRRIAMITMLLLFAATAFAITQDELEADFYPNMDWFSAQQAMSAELPEGLTEREADIYRRAFAVGHYAALHPSYIEGMYVLNTRTHKFHYSDCLNTLLIDSPNREHFFGSKEEVEAMHYAPCGSCKP